MLFYKEVFLGFVVGQLVLLAFCTGGIRGLEQNRQEGVANHYFI